LGADYEHVMKSATEQTEKLAAHVADLLRGSGLSVTKAVRFGDPCTEIVDDARAWGADLIVVGSRGRSGISRWFLGSVAEYVVRHARSSVEVLRSSIQATTTAQ
jgi:nucleotide-binding universal stress UspA family protein